MTPWNTWDRAQAVATVTPLLTGRCTLEAPVQGGGWTVAATAEPYRRDVGTPAVVPQPGGFISKQLVTFYFLPTAPAVGRGWRITDEESRRWRVQDGVDPTEALLPAVTAALEG